MFLGFGDYVIMLLQTFVYSIFFFFFCINVSFHFFEIRKFCSELAAVFIMHECRVLSVALSTPIGMIMVFHL